MGFQRFPVLGRYLRMQAFKGLGFIVNRHYLPATAQQLKCVASRAAAKIQRQAGWLLPEAQCA